MCMYVGGVLCIYVRQCLDKNIYVVGIISYVYMYISMYICVDINVYMYYYYKYIYILWLVK